MILVQELIVGGYLASNRITCLERTLRSSSAVFLRTLRVAFIISGSLQSQNYFNNNTRTLFAFLTLIPLQVCSGVFRRLRTCDSAID